jgi:tRNA threonylcarbamoyladenosine biosynthesis protein TsaE
MCCRAKLIGSLSLSASCALTHLVQNHPLQWIIAAHDSESLQHAVKSLSERIHAPLLIRVKGNLGAGKTTLIGALLGYWQGAGANSPSFNLRNDYVIAGARVIHIDLYRLKEGDDALDLLPPDEDYSDTLVFVEWPEKAPQHLFAPFPRQAELLLEVQDDNARRITWRLL